MQKIIPNLWFDTQAKESSDFYVSIFPDSKIISHTVLHNTPSGDADQVTFSLGGYTIMSISARPYFKTNPSVSFMVNYDPSKMSDEKESLDAAWAKLSDGGKVMMELGKYPFSEWYGWIEDKYGVSWQLMLTNPAGEPRPFIIPSQMFVGDVCGKAEEATDYYISIFKNAKRGTLAKYPAGMDPEKESDVMFTDFQLEGQWFAAMDSARMHDFKFTEGNSYMVNCDTQEEIDYFWEKLSAVPESEQCGWVKDKYGFSWQISPTILNEMMANGTQEQVDRVTQAFLPMKKLDIAKIKQAYEGA